MKREKTATDSQLTSELYQLRRQLEVLEERLRRPAIDAETKPARDPAGSWMPAETEQHRRILEAAPEAITAVDGNRRIVQANEQAQILFGYDQDELLGQAIEMLVAERVHEIHSQHRQRYQADPRTRPMRESQLLAISI